MEFDYGFRERGKSFEESAFYETFKAMGHTIIRFDYMELIKVHGKYKMNQLLRDTVDRDKPDLLFCVLFKDEIDKNVITAITKETATKTLSWFCDDQWRFDAFTRFWAPSFTWSTTTDIFSIPKYKSIGYKNVILTQWGANHYIFKKNNVLKKYDVTFIGQPYGDRAKIIDKLQKHGINIQNWGTGAKNGRLTYDEVINVFNESKINLNFSSSFRHLLMFWQNKRRDQIKARNFEIPATGSFQLASYVAGIEEYFIPEKEIVCYKNFNELEDKIRYYIMNESERENIAKAGYDRFLREHTYEIRFKKIFDRIFA
jgi:spore maturation protein CgeB